MANELIAIRGTVTPVGWQAPENMTRPEWEQIGLAIQQADKMMGWVIGDWLASGERKWGEMYTEAMELTGYELTTLQDYKYTADNVQFSVRTEQLSLRHHRLVAKFRDDPDRQRYWLQQAEDNNWSVRQLREAIQESERPKFECDTCGEIFDKPVWHCPTCDGHWFPNQSCPNCRPKSSNQSYQDNSLPMPPPLTYRSLDDIPQEKIETFVPTEAEQETIGRMTALITQQSKPELRKNHQPTERLESLKQLWRDATETERQAFLDWLGLIQ